MNFEKKNNEQNDFPKQKSSWGLTERKVEFNVAWSLQN